MDRSSDKHTCISKTYIGETIKNHDVMKCNECGSKFFYCPSLNIIKNIKKIDDIDGECYCNIRRFVNVSCNSKL
jgi:DNA-directed RNA polymerase subunit RPC12/RpoP